MTQKPVRGTSNCGISFLKSTVSLQPASSPSNTTFSILLVIFIPGYSCRASDFTLLIEQFAAPLPPEYRSYCFISIDLPGHGETPKSVCAEPSVEAFATLVNHVRVEHTEFERARGNEVSLVFVGHSLGARIVLEAFTQQPNGVVGIAFVDGSHYLLRPKGYLEQQQATFGKPVSGTKEKAQREVKSLAAIQVEREKALEELFSTMFSPLTPEEFRKTAVADAKASIDYLIPLRRSHIAWDQSYMDFTVRAVAESEVRVLALQSTDSSGNDRRGLSLGEENAWMRFVRERMREGRYKGVVVDGTGHFPHVDRAGRVVEVMGEWMQTLSDRSDMQELRDYADKEIA